MNWLRGFLDNNSVFGRLMTRCGILIASNLLFVLFSLPIVTAGAALAGLYYTMLKTLRGDGELNPFRTFWEGFRSNFKQATMVWLILLALVGVLALEIFWCRQFAGPVALFRYGLMALLVIVVILAAYLFPTMAAFRATLPQLVQDCIFFAIQKPIHLILILFSNIVPMVLTYVDYGNLPLYAFVWCVVGFSAVAMFCSSLLLKQFLPYLPKVDACGDVIEEGEEAPPEGAPERSEAEILDEMKKLGM